MGRNSPYVRSYQKPIKLLEEEAVKSLSESWKSCAKVGWLLTRTECHNDVICNWGDINENPCDDLSKGERSISIYSSLFISHSTNLFKMTAWCHFSTTVA